MKKTIGIFAHVDAGKTTFSEQLLYYTGSIRDFGRVDHKNSYMDTDEIEKRRGITIFADQGIFTFKEDTYYLIDTPGHVDFSAEMERVIGILDYAILLISGSSGVQAHTNTLFRILKAYKIPTFLFINKADMEGFRLETILEDIRNKLTDDVFHINSSDDIFKMDKLLVEFVAERDMEFMEAYLQENNTTTLLQQRIISLIKERNLFLAMSGSALKGVGIDTFMEVFSRLTPTIYEETEKSSHFVGKVYKIRHDEKGNRVTFIKAMAGNLQIKDEFIFEEGGECYREKVNEIRIYNGKKFENQNTVFAGDVFAITGLKAPICGTNLEIGSSIKRGSVDYYLVPALQSKVNILDGTNVVTCIEKLRILEAEDPMLSVFYQEETGAILVSVMGKIQLEVLEQLIGSRFGISIKFEKPQVQYRETIASPIIGYGHFEPLRHYAEVQLRMEPNPRGTGITFTSECHVDNLATNYQNLIKHHVFEKIHKGVLTGSPIADVNIVLQNGRAHLKHTDGGDFREATYRAIRQGLEKAESVLLEPFYQFEINVEQPYLGRVMSDIQKLRGTFESPIHTDKNVYIRGRGPVASFMDYSTDLVSFTKGNGNISLLFHGYDLCMNAEEVVEQIGYDKERDMENPSSSVFCAKGTSFVVPWYEAEDYMHTI